VSLLVAILLLVLVAAVFMLVSAPLRRAARSGHDGMAAASPPPNSGDLTGDLARDELEAAREAKYREIRDAELDYRTGKLSLEDYEAIDGALRQEAIEILNRLEGSGA
jgi:hypothetical protein